MPDNGSELDGIEVPSERNMNGTQLDTIELTSGDMVAICRCKESNFYPICDGSHQALAEKIYPAVVKVVDSDDVGEDTVDSHDG